MFLWIISSFSWLVVFGGFKEHKDTPGRLMVTTFEIEV